MNGFTSPNGERQWRRHEVLARGTDSGPSNPPTPKSDSSSDFGHFILKILKNLKKWLFLFKNPKSRFLGETYPFLLLIGGCVPRPPVSAPMVRGYDSRNHPRVLNLICKSRRVYILIVSKQCSETLHPFLMQIDISLAEVRYV